MKRILPGFPLTLGLSLSWLSLMVIIPIAALAFKALGGDGSAIWSVVTSDRVAASYRLSFGVSLIASLINGLFGLITAWTLVRYRFPGRKFIEGLVDLPFALPTAVAGISLTALYAPNGWLGALLGKVGIQAVFNPIGVGIALVFIGFPFVVRTLEPVLIDLAAEVEEAAATLGANRWQTFTRVIFPALLPALLTGMTLAFGRAVGEYGSIIFISGNLPFKTEITPLLIVSRLEQYDYHGAAAIGLTMLLFSFAILTFSCLLQAWSKWRIGASR
ncbi:MAG TPA: sulfate ABC transporter permease subunit CysT [Chthoniobacteraceae bacterium]|nr:sulfate ABC transporter permease subunit CysT [Chthoniobacteraceae bacterium]